MKRKAEISHIYRQKYPHITEKSLIDYPGPAKPLVTIQRGRKR